MMVPAVADDITQKLGKGAYAVVFKAIDKKTKETVALKKIFDAFQNATDAQRTFREIMYLQALATPKQHPNIIRLRNFLKAENDKDIVRNSGTPPQPTAPPLSS